MMKYSIFAILLTTTTLSVAKNLPFPKEFQRCRKDDPYLDECVKDAIQKAIPFLVKGMPKYGIIPADPMITNMISMHQDIGPVPIDLTFSQLISKGNAKAIVKCAHADVDNHKLSITVYSPNITLEGNYNMKASVFLIPVEGNGAFEINLQGVETTADLEGTGVVRSGDEYFKITKVPIKMSIQKIHINFKNLFNGNGKLGKNINWFLNRYAHRIFKELQPLSEETQGNLVQQLAQPFFDRVPYTELYL